MPHLSLRFFGSFEAALDGVPITAFESAKSQALLAYLALEPDRPHSRLKLAGLLWSERSDTVARTNLRNALSSLRLAIGDRGADTPSEEPPVLTVTRGTVQFNSAGDCWVDVRAFQALLADGIDRRSVASLEDAIALYRGRLLDGFYVSDSPAFEDWVLVAQDRLERQAAMALQNVVEETVRRGDMDAARRFAWRWVELEPWQEEAHRQLMGVLASDGRRAEALAQFEACRRAVKSEFGVDVSVRTVQLYQQIRDETFVPGSLVDEQRPAASPYERLTLDKPHAEQTFVARERELASLLSHLEATLAGQGHVVFVTGEAGFGKTALIQAFARGVQAGSAPLAVLAGSCNAYTGVGDPYLPFREILDQAAGGEAGPAGDWCEPRRLAEIRPPAVEALLAHGQGLVDIFVSRGALTRSLELGDALQYRWTAALREALARATGRPHASMAQEDLFEQATAVLRALAQKVPLLLVLDDLQWADVGSTSLLFHLGKRIAGSRILVVGAYRPEEVALGRSGERHPLSPVIQEFRRQWGDIEVDLHLAEKRAFVEKLVASRPNSLSSAFLETLLTQTDGHALFTVELLRGMQERGDLIRDGRGRWLEGPMLRWDVLPTRVEAVIAERIGRLSPSLRAILQRASVEGEVFTAQVAAQARRDDIQETVSVLSGELDRRHRLIRAAEVLRIDGRRLSRYRFRHILFQRHIYQGLDPVERVHLHEQVGDALEELYSVTDDALASVAPQLARHFSEAGNTDKAVRYYELAGRRATQMLAHQEAIAHFDRAIELLDGLPATPERDVREVGLRLAIAAPTMMVQSWGAAALAAHYRRAEVLAEGLSDPLYRLNVLSLVRMYYTVRADHRRSVQAAERYLSLARELDDPLHLMVGHTHMSNSLVFTGDFRASLEHLDAMLARYDNLDRAAIQAIAGSGNPKAAALSICLYAYWYLGYPDRAVAVGESALALAESLNDPMSIYFALAFKTRLHRWRGDLSAVEKLSERLRRTWTDYHMPMGLANALQDEGWLLSQRGRSAEGIPLYRKGLEGWNAAGMANHLTEFYGVLAEMHGKAGEPAEGLRLIGEAMAIMERTGERYHEAELYRLRGELRLLEDPRRPLAVARDFQMAIGVAQQQSAKMLELRAAMSLCRLWRDQGTAEALAEARGQLGEVYGWFTEGLDTRDLVEAKALIDEV